MLLNIDTSGQINTIYSDDLRGLIDQGDVSITRASHVEPTSDGKWEADLSPVNGPILGPFAKRKEALRAELQWLEINIIQK